MSFNLTNTAQEAYTKALEKAEEQLDINLKELDNLINKAIEKGQFSIIYDKELIYKTYHFDTLNLLTQMGYKVTEKETKEKAYWIISWDIRNND